MVHDAHGDYGGGVARVDNPKLRCMSLRRLSPKSGIVAIGLVFAVVLVSTPLVGLAQKATESPSAQRERVRAEKAQVATKVSALRASDAEVSQALSALQDNVAGQQALFAEAQRAAVQADQALADAAAAVESKTAEIAVLRDDIRAFAIEAFVHPPSDDALAALDSDDPGEAAEKRALLKLRNTNDDDLLDRLGAAEEDLQVERALAIEAAAQAKAKKADAEGRLGELTLALEQQTAYANQVQSRLDRALAEADNLADLDATLSQQIRNEQGALARRNVGATSGSGRPGGGGGSLNPGLGSVACPNGGSITVATSITGSLRSLIDAASAAGIVLCGGGYRSAAAQIDLRRAHCGTSDYAIYQMPSSQCSPPTAPPGLSLHERGLAVDFTCNGGGVISSRSSPCFRWLAANAPGRGFYNLPSEPWHWSVNGN